MVFDITFYFIYYRNYLCVRCTIFHDFSIKKLELHIIMLENYITLFPVTCLTIYINYIYSPNECFILRQRNIHWNVCLFIILFLIMWVYFRCSLVAFLLMIGWFLWHINAWRLFNAKASLYIYILNIYDLLTFYWLHFLMSLSSSSALN